MYYTKESILKHFERETETITFNMRVAKDALERNDLVGSDIVLRNVIMEVMILQEEILRHGVELAARKNV